MNKIRKAFEKRLTDLGGLVPNRNPASGGYIHAAVEQAWVRYEADWLREALAFHVKDMKEAGNE